MAKLYLTEYVGAGRYYGGSVPVADVGGWKENAASPMTVSSGAVGSSIFSTNTHLIRVHTDAIASIIVGPSPLTATANNARLAANQTEYYYVEPGQILSVIANT